jgi:hypothetical protein
MSSQKELEPVAGKCVEAEVKLDGGVTGYVEPEMSASAIPNLNELLEKIIEMVEFMNTPQMVKKKRTDPKNYEYTIFFKYREHMPTKIIDLLIENHTDNLQKLITMFETLNGIKMGNLDMTTEYEKFTENVNEEYLYPSFGGKDKFRERMNNLAPTLGKK